MAQVQIQLDERWHKTLKYRSAQLGVPMGRLIEQMLAGLKQRALRVHRRLGQGSFVDDSIIIQALIEGDQRGFDEQGIIDLASVDLFQAEQDVA